MAKTNKFQKVIDDLIEDADGDEQDLADSIVEYIEEADLAELQGLAEFVAKALLADNDNEED
jgi:formate dehydrogenase maturation protein FdhE